MVLLGPLISAIAGRRNRRAARRCSSILLLAVWLISACTPSPTPAPPTPAPPTPAPPTPAPPTATPDPDVLQFPNGHTARGAFRGFWQARDGTTLLGQPLTEALWIDGRLVQHFERGRLDRADDGSITQGAIGVEQLAALGIEPPPAEPRDGCRFVDQTRHNLCGAFQAFWEAHGGADGIGQPVSEPQIENRIERQWFERGRLERPLGGEVRLAALGDEVLARVPANAVLREPGRSAAEQRADLQGSADPVQPLDTVRAVLDTEAISGTATILWGDTRGHAWASDVALTGDRSEVATIAQGALGQHGAAILIDGRVAGVRSDVYRLDATSAISTGQPRFDELLPRVKAFMDQDVSEYDFGDYRVRGYRSPDNDLLWLRDHVHQGKGYAYWEQDMTSLLDQFARFQHADGSFDDYIGSFEFGAVRGRKEVEADLEYLFVEGVYRAWQATGDDAWMRAKLTAMERGLRYAMTDPKRWDADRRLVKRPYTIDTWDFEIGQPTIAPDGRISPRHWIDEQTKWAIFHGDNTGYAQAMDLLARMYERLGDSARATYWRGESRGLIDRLNALAWNGRFYRHMVPLQPIDLPVDTEQQLSLSNAYALNRGVLTTDQATAIVGEYQARRRTPDQAFAEWYSIDPPFPTGTTSIPDGSKGYNPGEYVNGGIMPLVGGELAQGAFGWGFEDYGFDILQRYYSLISGTGASYLWYYPIGQPGISGPDTLPTDGWGASAMLAGLIEGAAGVADDDARFSRATIAPRWSAAGDVRSATVVVRYGASDGYVAYRWQRTDDGLIVRWTGSGESVRLRVLLPADAPDALRATLDGQPIAPQIAVERASRYAEFAAPPSAEVRLSW